MKTLKIEGIIVIMFFCASQLCQSQNMPLELLVSGVNEARAAIETGEMQLLVTLHRPARKSPDEIQAWIEKSKEEVSRENHDDRILKQLIQEIPVEAEWFFGEHEDIEQSNVAFGIFNHDSVHLGGYQFKMHQIDSRGMDLYSDTARYLNGGYYRMLAYDARVQVYEEIYPTTGVAFDNRDSWLGFLGFQFLGRSRYRVPSNARLLKKELIGNTDCYVIEFQPEGQTAVNLVRIWVDPQADFCILREERVGNEYLWEMIYEDFQAHKEIWFPKVSRLIGKSRGKIESSWTIVVNEALFNLNFPPDFFKIVPEIYLNQGLEVLPGSKTVAGLELTQYQSTPDIPKPDIPQDESNLLRCGPNSLLRVCEILAIDTNFAEIAKLSEFNPDVGTTMLGLYNAARTKNLNPRGIKANIKALGTLSVPAIAYVGGNHFLVFEKIDSDGVLVFDPASPAGKGSYFLPLDRLSQIWSGELLTFDRKAEVMQSKSAPYVSVDSNYYDFGAAPGGSRIKHTFQLKNTGSEILKIFKVERTCACTATVVSHDEIFPGQYGAIEAVLTVPSENREVEEKIYVYTNSPQQDRISLILKGTAFLPISTFPSQVFFGKVTSRTTPRKILTVHRAIEKDVQIMGVSIDSPDLTATIVSGDVNRTTRVEVAMLASMPVGQFAHRLSIDYTYENKEATHDVSVMGEVLGAFSISPRSFFFGFVDSEKETTKTVTISSTDSKPFKIVTMQSTSKHVVPKIIPQEGIGYKIAAVIDWKQPSGKLSGEILVKTDNLIQSSIRLPFFAVVGNRH